jgi:hypothetical protein
MFWAAGEDGVLSFGTVVLAFILGTALMYYPLAVAILAKKTGWQEQPAKDPTESCDPAEETAMEETAMEQTEIEVEGRLVEPPTEVLDATEGDRN